MCLQKHGRVKNNANKPKHSTLPNVSVDDLGFCQRCTNISQLAGDKLDEYRLSEDEDNEDVFEEAEEDEEAGADWQYIRRGTWSRQVAARSVESPLFRENAKQATPQNPYANL